MARTYVAVITDDLIGETTENGKLEAIEFTVNGKSYTIDLGTEGAAEFHRALDRYIAVATRVGVAAHGPTPTRSRNDLAAIRAWASNKGHTVAARDRISADVKAAYASAH